MLRRGTGFPVSPFFFPVMKKSDRQEIVNAIMNDPESYKVCCICGGIVDRSADICPDCSGYRFDDDKEAVSNRALDLASGRSNAVTHLDDLS